MEFPYATIVIVPYGRALQKEEKEPGVGREEVQWNSKDEAAKIGLIPSLRKVPPSKRKKIYTKGYDAWEED